jgi:HK97 family phage major capsid protein
MADSDTILTTVNDMKNQLSIIAEKQGQTDGIVKANAIKKDELEKMKTDILLEFEKKFAESKMPLPVPEKKQGMKLAEFMLKAKVNHSSLSDLFIKTSMTEGSAYQGSYTVPVEYGDMILGALNNESLVVNRFTPLVHNMGYIKYMPKWLTDLSIYWVDEEAVKTQSKPTITRVTSTLKKICAVIVASDEYLQDDITGMEGQLAKLVGENIAIELERLAFIGSTGAGDAFNGVFSSTPNSVTQAGAHIIYSDLTRLLNHASMLERYRVGAEFFMNRTMLGGVMGIVDSTGRPLWNMQLNAQGQLINTILGIPITVCTSITDTCATLGAKSVIFYGNPNQVMIGRKAGQEGVDLLVSQHGIISTSTSVTVNLFTQDETGFRFVLRRSVVIPVALAWTVLDEAAV